MPVSPAAEPTSGRSLKFSASGRSSSGSKAKPGRAAKSSRREGGGGSGSERRERRERRERADPEEVPLKKEKGRGSRRERESAKAWS